MKVNDKIFVIISGNYSDWRIEGYETDREKAELVCYHHNHLPDDQQDWLYCNWRVEAIDKVEIDGEIPKIYWNYEVTIYKRKSGLEVDEFEEDRYIKCDETAWMANVMKVTNNTYTVRWSNPRFLNWEEAKKIAIDMLTQELAALLLG